MTKPLDPKEKQRRRKERRKKKRETKKAAQAQAPTAVKKGQQQKAPSPTVKTIVQPKPPEEKPKPPAPEDLEGAVNLCEDCAFEYGECDGVPKFASEVDDTLTGAAADRVIGCPGFVHVDNMPTADELEGAPGPKADADQNQGKNEDESEFEPEPATAGMPTAKPVVADLPRQPDPQRFQEEQEFGTCATCTRPLKRTAFNRYRDAVRCTNPRCRQYRAIVKTIPTGVK